MKPATKLLVYAVAGASLLSLLAVPCAAKKVKLVYMMWDVNIAKREQKEVVEEFEKANPNVDVELQTNPWGVHFDKILTTIMAGKGPDIFEMSVGQMATFARRNLLLDLNPYVSKWLTSKEYFTELLKDGRYPSTDKGKLYALPFAFVNSVTYYNKTLFDAQALPYPDTSWDYDTLLAYAKKLTKDKNGDGKPDQWGFQAASHHEILDTLIKVYGGQVLNDDQTRCMLDSPKAIEAIQFMVDMIYKHRVSSPTGIGFDQGKLGMAIGGSYAIETYRKAKNLKWDIAVVPKGPTGIRLTYGGPDQVSVSRATKHPREAVEFMKYIVGKNRTVGSFMGGKVPFYKPLAYSDAWLEKNMSPAHKQVILDSAPFMVGADFGYHWTQWRTEAMIRELAPAFENKKSVQDSVKAAVKAIELLLDKKPVK